MIPEELQAALEAIIYAADEPATLDQIANALGVEKMEARTALDWLVASYQVDGRGIEVRKVAGGWKFSTKAQHHDVVRKFIKSLQPPLRLTMPALETLAVIAYKQPATVPEINEIRGVNVGGVIKTLLEKRLITTAGRKEVIGRPILYRTSKQFLIRFGLSDLDELPSLKEFEQLAQAALGSEEGIAPIEPPEIEAAVSADHTALMSQSADHSGNDDHLDTEFDGGLDNDLGELAEDAAEHPAEHPYLNKHVPEHDTGHDTGHHVPERYLPHDAAPESSSLTVEPGSDHQRAASDGSSHGIESESDSESRSETGTDEPENSKAASAKAGSPDPS